MIQYILTMLTLHQTINPWQLHSLAEHLRLLIWWVFCARCVCGVGGRWSRRIICFSLV